MIYRTDYHVHTHYSDGNNDPAKYIASALKENISELGFSDHLTLTPVQQEWSIKPENLDNYVKEVSALKNSIKGLSVRLGLEVDYLPGKEDDIKAIISNYPFDYIIGSVHYMGSESVDTGPEFYQGKNIQSLYAEYFDLVETASGSGLFDIMAHVDLVRIFKYFPEKNHDPIYRKLAKRLRHNNVAIEINTNGINKPVKSFYPNPSLLYIFQEEGVPVCVNSDAHSPSNVAQFFDEAYSLLLRSGYKGMVTFDKRERHFRFIK